MKPSTVLSMLSNVEQKNGAWVKRNGTILSLDMLTPLIEDIGNYLTICKDATVTKIIGKGGEGILLLIVHAGKEYCLKLCLDHIAASGHSNRLIIRRGLGKNYVDDARNRYKLRFIRGCKIQSLLADRCQGIPRVYGILDEPYPVLIQEYIPGIDLWAWSKHKTNNQTLTLINELCQIVNKIHNFGVVHSDIKCSNILVTDNIPWLIDFSLAKNLSTSEIITQSGFSIISDGASPKLQERYADRRTFLDDIYAIGVLIISALLGYPANKISDHIYKIPKDIAKIVEKATCDEGRRYQSVLDLSNDITEYLRRVSPVITQSSSDIDWDIINLPHRRIIKNIYDIFCGYK